MIKLKDIIKSGGGNAKINRFINRYVLSKKEKKDIIDEIKSIKSNNSSSGSSSKYAPKYYAIDWNKANENWKELLSNGNLNISSISKINTNYGIVINTYSTSLNAYDNILAFCFQPLYVSKQFIEVTFGITNVIEHIDTIENAISLITELSTMDGGSYNISMEGITEITEEEFYKVN